MHLHVFGIMAKAAGVLVTPHSRGDSLGTVASLHFAASLQKTMFFGFPHAPTFPASTYQRTLKELLVFKDGMVHLPQGPGLGVELQEWIFGEVRA